MRSPVVSTAAPWRPAGYSGLHLLAFAGWIAFSFGGAVLFTVLKRRDEGGGAS